LAVGGKGGAPRLEQVDDGQADDEHDEAEVLAGRHGERDATQTVRRPEEHARALPQADRRQTHHSPEEAAEQPELHLIEPEMRASVAIGRNSPTLRVVSRGDKKLVVHQIGAIQCEVANHREKYHNLNVRFTPAVVFASHQLRI